MQIKKVVPDKRVPDAAWFTDRIDRVGSSKMALAQHLGNAEGSTITKYLNGETDPPTSKTVGIAAFLRVPVAEVIHRLGYTPPAGRPVPQLGSIQPNGWARAGAPKAIIPETSTEQLTGAYLIESGEYRGAVIYIGLTQSPERQLGRVCIVETAQGTRLRRVEPDRSGASGTYVLYPCLGCSDMPEEGVQLSIVAPVVSMHF